MASSNPFALIGNNNPSLEDDDEDEAGLESALEEKRREAARQLLDEDDEEVPTDAHKSDRAPKSRSFEGWVNEYHKKAVQEPDPSKPFVLAREWLLKLHRPDYAMPADFVFTPTITTQEPLPPVAFLPPDELVRFFVRVDRHVRSIFRLSFTFWDSPGAIVCCPNDFSIHFFIAVLGKNSALRLVLLVVPPLLNFALR